MSRRRRLACDKTLAMKSYVYKFLILFLRLIFKRARVPPAAVQIEDSRYDRVLGPTGEGSEASLYHIKGGSCDRIGARVTQLSLLCTSSVACTGA